MNLVLDGVVTPSPRDKVQVEQTTLLGGVLAVGVTVVSDVLVVFHFP